MAERICSRCGTPYRDAPGTLAAGPFGDGHSAAVCRRVLRGHVRRFDRDARAVARRLRDAKKALAELDGTRQ